MIADELDDLARLLYRYAETGLGQCDNWRLETRHGPVCVSVTRELLSGWTDQAFGPCPEARDTMADRVWADDSYQGGGTGSGPPSATVRPLPSPRPMSQASSCLVGPVMMAASAPAGPMLYSAPESDVHS
jgi:hypothetical protein